MFLSDVCYVSDMPDHDSWKIDLLTSIHEISEVLIHGICLVAPLAPWYNVLDDEPQ